MLRLPYDEVYDALLRVLLRLGFERERAARCARLFTDTSRDGVYSHGINRFPRFARTIRNGLVDIHAVPRFAGGNGPLERWNGEKGPGNLNAHQSMERAIELARQHGVGCVALANTNHWMRGGSYGWQAAEAGMIGVCWTNTLPNLPPWGASDARLGNNPLIIAVPRTEGHIVLDMAMSQFSYGVLQSYRMRGERLPVDGGFDSEGRLTRDPTAIEASSRPLPIGYWKGSGLALMLDLMAGLLSGGQFTSQIAPDPEKETGLSQVFVAFDLRRIEDREAAAERVDQVIQHLHRQRSGAEEHVRYPGEQVLKTRGENLANGIPIDESVWKEVLAT